MIWLDVLVITALAVVAAGLLIAWRRANRPDWWIASWAAWGLLFFALEAYGGFASAQGTPTFSEMLVTAVPLPIVITGTWILCGLLTVHWCELEHRLRTSALARARTHHEQAGDAGEGDIMQPNWVLRVVTAIVVVAIVMIALAWPAAPVARAADVLPQPGQPMTAEGLAALAGMALSLFLGYVPWIKTKYAVLTTEGKAAVMLVLLTLAAAAIFVGGCYQIVDYGIACTRQGALSLAGIWLSAVIANQGVFLLMVDPYKRREPETDPST